MWFSPSPFRGEGWGEGAISPQVGYEAKRCFDKHIRKPRPLTSILSSLLKTAAIHGRSPRAPKGRGGERGRCAPALIVGRQ